jgi:hypothetical protein
MYIFRASPPQKAENRPDLPLRDLEKVAVLYDSIRNEHKEKDPHKDKQLANDFDQHLKRVMESLLHASQMPNVPDKLKTVNGLRAKFDLYDICFDKFIDLLKEENPKLSKILDEIHTGTQEIVSTFYDISMTETPSAPSNMGSGTKDVQKYQNENKKLINMIESMESELSHIKKQNDNLKNRFAHEKSELQEQIDSLENENKTYLDTLIKHSKGEVSQIDPSVVSRPMSKGAPSDVSNRMSGGFGEKVTSRYQKSPPKISKNKEFTYSKYSSGRSKATISSSGVPKKGYKGAGGHMAQNQMRNLSLKQMKDIITDIYTQKVKYDQK